MESGKKKEKISFLVMDVDGTLTDGKIYMSAEGELMKAFNIKDGCGIHDVLPTVNGGITPVIITGRKSGILEKRCQELGITELHQGVSDKITVLEDVLKEAGAGFENAAYIGDDINDLACMEKCGLVGCPSDAVPEVLKLADFVSGKKGGEGAVRDFIEWLADTEY